MRFKTALIWMALLYVGILIFSYQDLIFKHEVMAHPWVSPLENNVVKPSSLRQWLLNILSFSLLVLYILGFRAMHREQGLNLAKIGAVVGGMSVLAYGSMLFDSTDVMLYINLGWLQSHYHLNPYLQLVKDISNWQHDLMLHDHWVKTPCVYGPLFVLMMKGICQLGNGHFLLTLYLTKLPNLLTHLGLTWLLAKTASEIVPHPPKRTEMDVVYLYGLNPFILLQQLANGHNDVLMSFFTILAFYALVRNRPLLVVPALITGALFKYITLLFLPFVGLWMLQRFGWQKTLWSIAAGILVGMAGLHLYPLSLSEWAGVFKASNLLYGSWQAFLFNMLLPAMGFPLGVTHQWYLSTQTILWVAFLGLAAWQFYGLLKKKAELSQVVHASLLTALILICVVRAQFVPWYLGMVLPLAFLLPIRSRLREYTLILSALFVWSLSWFARGEAIVYAMVLLVVSIRLSQLRTFSACMGIEAADSATTRQDAPLSS